jgi:hypothetical protein
MWPGCFQPFRTPELSRAGIASPAASLVVKEVGAVQLVEIVVDKDGILVSVSNKRDEG